MAKGAVVGVKAEKKSVCQAHCQRTAGDYHGGVRSGRWRHSLHGKSI